MTCYDSSVLIDYLDGDDDARDYVETHVDERAVSPPLVAYEVYQGEVFRSDPADFDTVDTSLSWLTVVDVTADVARTAAAFQAEIHRDGTALTARDAFIAGTAVHLDERLAVSDSDFDVDAVTDRLDVDFV